MNYTCTEQIHDGNDLGLTIQFIGSSSFLSPFNSKPLSLNQLLHVPSITKICLVSPSLQLTTKSSLNSNQSLLWKIRSLGVFSWQGHLRMACMLLIHHNFYQDFPQALTGTIIISTCSNKTCFSINKSLSATSSFSKKCDANLSNIFTLLHNRLGHPALSFVKNVMTSCNIPIVIKLNLSFAQYAVFRSYNFFLLQIRVQLLFILFILIYGSFTNP